MYQEKKFLCRSCAYCGDKYSFPLPNDLVGEDEDAPCGKHYYCCSGDCERYQEDITYTEVSSCECFEEL